MARRPFPLAAAAADGPRIEAAAEKGCDAVDPDNVEGFEKDTGFPLTACPRTWPPALF